ARGAVAPAARRAASEVRPVLRRPFPELEPHQCLFAQTSHDWILRCERTAWLAVAPGRDASAGRTQARATPKRVPHTLRRGEGRGQPGATRIGPGRVTGDLPGPPASPPPPRTNAAS